jgi:hypothetical protein
VNSFVIHIHLYLTSREAELTAYKNLKRLKSIGFKILVTSPKPLPLDFYEHVDHYYYDPENQLMELEYEKPEPMIWWNHYGGIAMNFVVDGFQKHSITVLRSMIKGAGIAKALGYNNVIRFEFDDFFGFSSLKKIKEVCKDIEDNKYDFYAYKNDYGNNKIDISTHLIFYSSDAFTKIFGHIKNEYDYKKALKEIGLENKAIILEEFIYRLIQRQDLNVLYQDGKLMNETFNDTHFNIHQSPVGVFSGLLSDVMIIKNIDKNDPNNLCVAAQNVSSDSPTTAYFDIYDHENNLINTISLYFEITGQWRYEYLSNVKNVSQVKIRHQNSPYHKTFNVYFENNAVQIQNIDIPNYHYQPEIVFK